MKTIMCSLVALVLSVNMYSQNAKKFYRTGEDFFKAGNYQDAISQFSSALGFDPEYKDAYFMRGCAYERTGEYSKAADDFNRLVVFDPKNAEVYYHLGKAYHEMKQYDQAINMLNKSTQLSRKYLPAYQQKILTLIAIDQSYNALKVSDTTLQLDGNAYIYYLQGLVNEKLNSLQKAEWAYLKSIKEDGKYLDAYIATALVQVQLNKIEEAMANCNQALKLDPNSQKTLLARSNVFLRKQDYRNAIDDVSRAIVLNPEDENLFFVRGQYYRQFSQHQNAINDFNKVLTINPKNADALYNRANCYEEISNFPAAIKDYEALGQISEFDVKAKQLLKRAQERLFELNRETENPKISIIEPLPQNLTLEVPNNKNEIRVRGNISDKSALSFVKINDKEVSVDKVNGQFEFSTTVVLDSTGLVTVAASDVYNNNIKVDYTIRRTEINPPLVSILAPIASDNGEIYLDNTDPTLYVEGKVVDESLIKSILIEGVTASFKIDEANPTFSANVNITNKNKFAVIATDIYGNEKTYVYSLNRENANIYANNPMGKTWVVFIENSNYRTFASLEGPTKDVTLMKAALSKYQISNIVHRKDMTKEQMEKFFAIELRDLIKSNRVSTLLIWYAGHGKLINETGYWIPIDANRDEEFTYFNINSLKGWLQTYSTLAHTLLINDACETGPTFFQAMRASLKERSCDDWQATRMKSSQVFSSAGYELAQDNSQFTKMFANLLTSNPNACMDINSIVIKISSSIPANSTQKPKFGKIAGLTDEDGTFFFVAKDK